MRFIWYVLASLLFGVFIVAYISVAGWCYAAAMVLGAMCCAGDYVLNGGRCDPQ